MSHDLLRRACASYDRKFPDDLAVIWNVAVNLTSDQSSPDPRLAFASAGLFLCGPFDVLAGHATSISSFVDHFRFSTDPPEAVTAALHFPSSGEPEHFVYWFDEPTAPPSLVASGDFSGTFHTWTGCLTRRLLKIVSNAHSKADGAAAPTLQRAATALRTALAAAPASAPTTAKADELGIVAAAARVGKGFHSLGIAVPVDKHTNVGYRAPALSPADTIRAVAANDTRALSELRTWTDIAVDEGDVGTALEVGQTLLACGAPGAADVLRTAYRLLGRDAFTAIAEATVRRREAGALASALPPHLCVGRGISVGGVVPTSAGLTQRDREKRDARRPRHAAESDGPKPPPAKRGLAAPPDPSSTDRPLPPARPAAVTDTVGGTAARTTAEAAPSLIKPAAGAAPRTRAGTLDAFIARRPVVVGDAAAGAPSPPPAPRARSREPCRYGVQCYRRAPDHRAQYSHPGDADAE